MTRMPRPVMIAIVATIVCALLLGVSALFVGLAAGVVLLGVDRLTPSRLDKRVTVPAAIGLLIAAGELALLLMHRQGFGDSVQLIIDIALGALVTAGCAAGVVLRNQPRLVALTLAAVAAALAGLGGFAYHPWVILVAAVLAGVAAAGAADAPRVGRQPKLSVVEPPSFWRHL